ncbi:MAG: pilin [Candidatus Altiarchaeota archaeon]
MKIDRNTLWVGLLLLLVKAGGVSGTGLTSQIVELNLGLTTLASALGVLVISYAGIRWVAADSPQERDDSKKMIMYVMVGLIIVNLADYLVQALYCESLQSTGVTC